MGSRGIVAPKTLELLVLILVLIVWTRLVCFMLRMWPIDVARSAQDIAEISVIKDKRSPQTTCPAVSEALAFDILRERSEGLLG
jgi:hypothetical protein